MRRMPRMLLGMLALGCWITAGSARGAAEMVTCKDGTTAKAGRGACGHHGGVARAEKSETSPRAVETKTERAAAVTCKDGTTAKPGRGACGHHGGIAKSEEPSGTPPAATATPPTPSRRASAPAPAAPPAERTTPPKAAAAAGATAQCKDGSYSHAKTHRGACSHHGGVAQWLDGQ